MCFNSSNNVFNRHRWWHRLLCVPTRRLYFIMQIAIIVVCNENNDNNNKYKRCELQIATLVHFMVVAHTTFHSRCWCVCALLRCHRCRPKNVNMLCRNLSAFKKVPNHKSMIKAFIWKATNHHKPIFNGMRCFFFLFNSW